MAKGDLFSTVLRGFHKEQVSQYLNDLIRKYEREKEELNKKYEGISLNVVQELRQENDRLRRELEQEKTRNAELEQQKGKISPDHQEDQDLEKLRLLASQIKSRMEEARQMEQAACRESERIIAEHKRKNGFAPCRRACGNIHRAGGIHHFRRHGIGRRRSVPLVFR